MKMMWGVYGCLKGSKMGFRMFSLQQSNCLFRPKQFEILLVEDEVAVGHCSKLYSNVRVV